MNTIRNFLILIGLFCTVIIAILLSVITGPVEISLMEIVAGIIAGYYAFADPFCYPLFKVYTSVPCRPRTSLQ